MTIIKEDYVSFEIAKLLKEKGFDEKCKYVWKLDKANNPQDTDGISKICAERFMEGESFVDNSDIKKVSEYEDWLEDYHKAYLCPTLQMAMKWLRKRHNICVVSFPVVTDDDGEAGCLWNYVISRKIKTLHNSDSLYESSEFALSNGLKYALENLI